MENKILDTFRKVQVNILLLDTIKQVPKYAKFLKDLCSKKKKIKGDKVMQIEDTYSTMLRIKIPPKLKDPSSFTILCFIGSMKCKVILDLGACINVMPYPFYTNLNVGCLKETSVIIQLGDSSNVYPRESWRMFWFKLIFLCFW
ncbi:hypothetical protein REPUB_Repub07fG0083000 [Reevesia pubescens]